MPEWVESAGNVSTCKVEAFRSYTVDVWQTDDEWYSIIYLMDDTEFIPLYKHKMIAIDVEQAKEKALDGLENFFTDSLSMLQTFRGKIVEDNDMPSELSDASFREMIDVDLDSDQ